MLSIYLCYKIKHSMYERFAKLYDALMRDVDYDAWAAYINGFLPPACSVAECACGTGELSLRLANAGHKLTGIDISREMLAVASEKARKDGKNIPFVCMDMRHFSLHKPVDAVLCACDGVNYLNSREAAADFFRAADKALKPGGLLLFDISSRFKLSTILGCNSFVEDDGDNAYIWKNYYDAETKLIEMRLSFFTREGKNYTRFTETHVQRAHSVTELSNALKQTGFDAKVYDAFTRSAPGEDSERIQFVAVKAK